MYRHLSRFRLRRADLTGIYLLVVIGIGLLSLEGGMARAEEAPILEARVSKVLDGDTFTLSGESRRNRVWGLGCAGMEPARRFNRHVDPAQFDIREASALRCSGR